MKRLAFILGICCILASSCKQELESPAAIDTSYFPLKVGDSLVYRYNVQRWIGFFHGNEQAITSFYKEYIESYFLNAEGDTIFRLECYTRPDTLSEWNLIAVNHYRKTPLRVFKTLDNLTFEKMNFPVKDGKTWDANIFIDSVMFYNTHYQDDVVNDITVSNFTGVKSDSTRISKTNQPYSVNGKSFPETVTVTLHNKTSAIHDDYEVEVYAKNIGLIYKKQFHLEKSFNNSTGQYEPWNGYLKEWVIDN